MFRLTGSRCYLVPFEEKHINDTEYLDWLRDYDVVKTINRPDYLLPVSLLKVREYCETIMRSSNDMFLAIYDKKDEIFIGTMRAGHINWQTGTADIGIMIGNRNYWGKGIATDAIKTLGQFLFHKVGLRRLTAGLMAANPAMMKAFQRAGFRQEGILRQHDSYEGKFMDHIYLGCLRDEFQP